MMDATFIALLVVLGVPCFLAMVYVTTRVIALAVMRTQFELYQSLDQQERTEKENGERTF